MVLTLNGFRVDPDLERLMLREDWSGKRTHENWLKRFPGHADSSGITFVEFCSPDWARSENRGIQLRRFASLFGIGKHEDSDLNGVPDSKYPPGDFDPWHGYLIGFTDYCDAGIFVDLRPSKPRIIYDNLAPLRAVHATAFDTLGEFLEYCEEHLQLIQGNGATL